ncbi:MAG: hypothetical protein EBS39_13255 [Gammaproteobacteria bacterium]|nr:hypothetical protein [Gammaproteobacteria bacterium]
MSTKTPSPASDVAYLRELAEAGRQAPPDGGPYLVAGGGWFALASLAIGAGDTGLIPASPSLPGVAMLVAFAGFAVSMALLMRRDRGKVQNDANRFVGAAWSAVGISIFFFWAAVAIVAARTGEGFIMNTISLMVLAAYGAAWRFTGEVFGKGLSNAVTGLCFASMLVVAAAIGTPWMWLAYAAALVLCAVLPGLALMRKARAAQA